MTSLAAPVEPSLDRALVDEAEQVLQRHAKSFRFAAPLLPRAQRADAAVIYAFCRLVDDLADESPTPEVADRELALLEREVEGESVARPLVRAYLHITTRRGIPAAAASELIRGVRTDLQPVRCADDRELHRYCYRVAGTVGLMMCGVMGVSDPRSFPFALDLGIAMQLTNICRDVLEDTGRDRVYLPRTRLEAEGLPPEALLDGSAPVTATWPVVRALLDEAERYYDSGHAGLRYVPLRPRLAIYVAGAVYRAIGRKMLRRGPRALEGRTFTTLLEKVAVAGLALVRGLASVLRRRPAHEAALHLHLAGLPAAEPPAET